MARSCLSYRLDRVIDFRQRSLIICDLTLRDLGHVEESEMVRLSMHEAKVTVPQLIPPPCWRYAMLQQCKYYKWLANCCVWNYTTTAAAIEFTVRESRWHENFPDFFCPHCWLATASHCAYLQHGGVALLRGTTTSLHLICR